MPVPDRPARSSSSLSPQQQAARLRFVVDGQEHCDHFLTPLADPAGKSVVVLGAGAGTEMLWCLRHGAREVVGIDILEQDAQALRGAVAELGLPDPGSFELRRLPIEEAHRLERRFDLVLSNNVFEHVADLACALRACAQLVAPDGRVAIFTDPLYYSSSGAHLPLAPWEHLWGAPQRLRNRLLAGVDLPAGHALESLELRDYLDREISLNRMRLADFLEAVRASGLVFLNLRLIRDRHLGDLPASLERLERSPEAGPAAALAPADLAIEGLAAELALPAGLDSESARSTEERITAGRFKELERIERYRAEIERLHAEIGRLEAELEAANRHRAAAYEAEQVLRRVLGEVEQSWSFRVGRALTAPARWLRSLLRRQS